MEMFFVIIALIAGLLTGGVFMEMFFVIIALIAVCAAVFLRGKAWTDFTNDLSKKDTPDKK